MFASDTKLWKRVGGGGGAVAWRVSRVRDYTERIGLSCVGNAVAALCLPGNSCYQ